MSNDHPTSRRAFVARAGSLASVASLATLLSPVATEAHLAAEVRSGPSDWDLSWFDRVSSATDKAVFDWPTLGDPADPFTMSMADRYLQNCEAVYAPGAYRLGLVLNIRTQAVPAALNDAMWSKYALGVEYKTNDPYTKQPATRNPFWHRAPDLAPGYISPSLQTFVERGATLLVCDFALGHLAKRLADKGQLLEADVHKELLAGLTKGTYAVPSGIYGLAKAQNAGCAYMRF